ncbi:MAG TPA: hypothetical protein PLZ36_02185 [Armatimonadota bacterium]|nr:hypothetical protein [Armatimonadota bacterium]
MNAIFARLMPIVFCMMVCLPAGAQAPAAPPETLAGLTPGRVLLADAVRVLGGYDAAVPGSMSYFSGGEALSRAYRWAPGDIGPYRGVTVETGYRDARVNLIMVDSYPGLGTGRGLTTLVGDDVAVRLYGLPDFAFEWQIGYARYRELFYLDAGVHLVLSQITGRPNWTITRLILTYPAYLRNGVSWRVEMVRRGARVEDITAGYRVWARLAIPPE